MEDLKENLDNTPEEPTRDESAFDERDPLFVAMRQQARYDELFRKEPDSPALEFLKRERAFLRWFCFGALCVALGAPGIWFVEEPLRHWLDARGGLWIDIIFWRVACFVAIGLLIIGCVLSFVSPFWGLARLSAVKREIKSVQDASRTEKQGT